MKVSRNLTMIVAGLSSFYVIGCGSKDVNNVKPMQTGTQLSEVQPSKKPSVSNEWTSETKRIRVAVPQGEEEKDITYYTNTIGMKFVLLQPGEFMMGCPEVNYMSEGYCLSQHRVRITKPFYIGAYEVTEGQWNEVMLGGSSNSKSIDNPVDDVSWDMAIEFCKRLSQKEGKTYRLPTEAEHEYACDTRFTTGQVYYGNDLKYAERCGEYGIGGKKPVGQMMPNGLGIYDIFGNVLEVCMDFYDKNYYNYSPVDDPTGSATGSTYVVRGSWCYPENSKVYVLPRFEQRQSGSKHDTGFRVVLPNK